MLHDWFDALPLWAVYLGTVALSIGAVELGLVAGRRRRDHHEPEDGSAVGAMVGATLGLLAFMLAFTFGLASSRFEDRKEIVLNEANAIGTAWLRAGLLAEPEASRTRALLHDYARARIDFAEPATRDRGIAASERLHVDLWAQAEAMSRREDDARVIALFVGAINDVIDLHATRLNHGVRNRIAGSIWFALYLVSLFTMGAVGYQAGLAKGRRSPVVLVMVLAFATVLLLITDLDRPQKGLLVVSQAPMQDLLRSMDAAPPPAPAR
ncbi:hypothetical protein [Arenimonas sp. MALMAid1274]|uniref:bestrophin-like domain n=1 Tax=Arenimonas sp. MALMAid1274 TaxID=3411630 RepID=UPI003B9E2E1F